MVQTDKDALLEMGFSEAKVLKALKVTKNAGLQSAMDWLFQHADDPETTTTTTTTEAMAEDDGEITADQATAQSLKCDDCGKLLRDATAAEMHAVKTKHANFSESTEAIKPLTAEEKQEKLKQLQARLAEKREEKKLLQIEELKEKEKIRRRTGQEVTQLKEKKEQEEMKKALEAKKREKEQDRLAKERVRAQLEADKKERQRKAEEKKLAAKGISPSASSSKLPLNAASTSQPTSDYNETRLQIRVTSGPTLTQSFSAEDTLQKVYSFLEEKIGSNSLKLWQTFPRKCLDGPDDLNKTLKELRLVPSAALIAQ